MQSEFVDTDKEWYKLISTIGFFSLIKNTPVLLAGLPYYIEQIQKHQFR